MLIVHSAPFAPNGCGLYEEARDMVKADVYAGHQVYFVNTGIPGKTEEAGIEGLVDDRAGFKLTTADKSIIKDADLLFFHTDVNAAWYATCLAPIIWVVHGRPKAAFLPEVYDRLLSYSMYHTTARWPRTIKMMYFWKEFIPYWQPFFEGKDLVLDHLVVDTDRFKPSADKFELTNKGDFNFIICDSEREDVSLFDMINSLIYVSRSDIAKKYNFKFHFFGLTFPLKNCWNILFGGLKDTGCLGDLYPRIGDMEKVYNAADCLISPNKIITRTVAESVCCGTPVICQQGGKHQIADIYCDLADGEDTVEAFELLFNTPIKRSDVFERSKVLNIENYNKQMVSVYDEVIGTYGLCK